MAEAAKAPAFKPTPKRCRVVHCWVSAEVYALLEREAARLNRSPDRLAGDALSIIAPVPQAFDRILDV